MLLSLSLVPAEELKLFFPQGNVRGKTLLDHFNCHNSWLLAVEFIEKDSSMYVTMQSRKTEVEDNVALTGLNC